MHELSIAQTLVESVAAAVHREKASRASAVMVRVGTFSGVDPVALRAAFGVARESDKSTARTRLSLKIVKAQGRCADCGAVSRPDFPALACPRCGSSGLTLDGGRDLVIESVELEIRRVNRTAPSRRRSGKRPLGGT